MFFSNATPATEILTLSLHDALPICLSELLVEEPAIGKTCQHIVAREVSNLLFGPAPLGDVLVRGHPAAVGHGPACDRSEERRVGKEVRSRVPPDDVTKNHHVIMRRV